MKIPCERVWKYGSGEEKVRQTTTAVTLARTTSGDGGGLTKRGKKNPGKCSSKNVAPLLAVEAAAANVAAVDVAVAAAVGGNS